MNKSLLLAAAAAVAAVAALRRKRTQADTAQLWREATADASR